MHWLCAGAQRDALVSLGDRHLKAMELERRVFIKARALSLAQRLMLYARDELEMAVRIPLLFRLRCYMMRT